MRHFAWLLWLTAAGCGLSRSPLLPVDAAGLDAPGRDAPAPDVPGLDAPRLDTPGCDPIACDDGNPCTDDACDGAGCTHRPNAAVCDDGLFCTFGDTCRDGACVGGGATCPSCDEGADACTGCTSEAECPNAGMPILGVCAFDTTCAEVGSQSVSTWTCDGGACVEHPSTTTCVRSTEGFACGDPRETSGPCTASGCVTTGTHGVHVDTPTCVLGSCVDLPSDRVEACAFDPTGQPCETCMRGDCVAAFRDPCTGTASSTCMPGTCDASGACVSTGMSGMTILEDCSVPAGTACMDRTTCGPCMRGGGSGGCSMSCTLVTGACDGAGTCMGSSATITAPCTGC